MKQRLFLLILCFIISIFSGMVTNCANIEKPVQLAGFINMSVNSIWFIAFLLVGIGWLATIWRHRCCLNKRKKDEQLLRFGDLIDALEDKIHVVDRDLNLVLYNDSFQQSVEALYDVEEIKGKPVNEILPFLDPSSLQDYKGIFSSGEMIINEHFVDIHGKKFWSDVRRFPVFDEDGEVSLVITVVRDITERKEAEAALRKSEEKYRLLFDNMINGFALHEIITDEAGEPVDFRYLDANKAFGIHTGLSVPEIIGKRVKDVLPEVESYWIENYGRVALSGEPMSFVQYSASLDKYFNVYAFSPKRGQFAIIFNDVTEYKRTENALKESQARLQSILDHTPTLINIKDLAGRYVLINQKAETVLGIANEDIRGKTPFDVFSEKTAEQIIAHDKRVIDSQSSLKTEENVLSEYGIQTLLSVRFPIFDNNGELIAIGGIFTDISERKKAEEEMLVKERAIESSINAIAIADLQGNLTYVNASFLRLWGYEDMDNVIGEKVLDFWHSTEKASEVVQALGANGHWTGELVGKKKNGSLFDVQLSANMVFDKSQTPICMMASFIDITEQKRAERQLKETMRELERSNKELEQFAYVASHDLQEPLRMVTSYLQLLEKRYENQLDEDAQEFIYYAVDGAKRMQSLISDLLSYSRIKSRAKTMKNVNFQEIVERAKEHLTFMIEESEAEITYDELPTLKVDRGQMVQLIQNLINNSIKYNHNKPVIHISAKKQNNEWIFSVTDNGIGINAKYFERVFQIFQRLHTKREYSGTGIGLAICKKIIERHNGKIWVESEEDDGATFYFSIPKNAGNKD